MASVVQLMAAVMADVKAVGKDGRNTQQNFRFRGIDGTVNALGPALRAHGVVVVPQVQSHELSPMPLSGGKVATRCTVRVDYVFHGPEGDTITATAPGEAFDFGDKSTAKAMSVAFRTALLQSFALPTEESDPDEDTYHRTQAQPWTAEQVRSRIAMRRGDVTQLRADFVEAKSAGTPQELLDLIVAAAKTQPNEPVEGEIVDE